MSQWAPAVIGLVGTMTGALISWIAASSQGRRQRRAALEDRTRQITARYVTQAEFVHPRMLKQLAAWEGLGDNERPPDDEHLMARLETMSELGTELALLHPGIAADVDKVKTLQAHMKLNTMPANASDEERRRLTSLHVQAVQRIETAVSQALRIDRKRTRREPRRALSR